ncbi:MAG: hypothetical protein ACLGHY_00485, partial [Gammaproteobacteria bacterium]
GTAWSWSPFTVGQQLQDGRPLPSSQGWCFLAVAVVLLAGNGHVRTDIGVPRHLREIEPGATILAIAIGERGAVPPGSFDRVVATIAPVEREDPCESLRRRFGAHRESG